MKFEINELNNEYSEVIVHINGLAVNEGTQNLDELKMLEEEVSWFVSELRDRICDIQLRSLNK